MDVVGDDPYDWFDPGKQPWCWVTGHCGEPRIGGGRDEGGGAGGGLPGGGGGGNGLVPPITASPGTEGGNKAPSESTQLPRCVELSIQGAEAFADGFIPFVDPFAANGFYDPSESGLEYSQLLGKVTFGVDSFLASGSSSSLWSSSGLIGRYTNSRHIVRLGHSNHAKQVWFSFRYKEQSHNRGLDRQAQRHL